eukprot:TRINITY_DN10047_c0_g1_i1.p1 TRINITY_DN10047_c0_g1~~TRINITY_DN10047_c0_g1_i1.p1  ORF type:complete len:246 (+),score=78.28 TRINITY_DN10047_c0_g1_i1:73-738(+)
MSLGGAAEQQPAPAKENNDVADTINKGLSSAWGWFNKAKEAVKETGTKLAAELPDKMDKALETLKAMEDKPKEEKTTSSVCPWDDTPATWQQGDWEKLVKALVADEGTFLLGPDRGMTQVESRTLRKHSITVDFSIEKDEDYTAKVNREMLGYEPLGNMRFKMVPKFVKEEIFWRNLFWKLREFGRLESTTVFVFYYALRREIGWWGKQFPSAVSFFSMIP